LPFYTRKTIPGFAIKRHSIYHLPPNVPVVVFNRFIRTHTPAMPYTAANKHPPLVSSETLQGCLEAARELNISLDSILLEHSINPALLHSPSGYLRHSQATRFLQVIAERFHCDYFGFLVGKHQPPLQLGAVGRAMRMSPTFGVAIETALHYSHSFTEGTKYDLTVTQGMARLERWHRRSYPFGSTQMRMLGIVQVFKILNHLSGTDWRPSLITYTFSEPENPQQISNYFSCPVLFDQESDSLCFPERDLSRPMAESNSDLLKLVERELDRFLSKSRPEREISEGVRHYIRVHLDTQRCTMESCARFLHLSSRTLQRELEKHGTSFRQLLLHVRMEIARQYLSDSNIDLAALAGLLGYRNQSAFSRSFRLEHGVSPKQWRATAKL
jgi:AraC-like DNA-binding protein